jgi:DNA invertase Pin-like site-specific DNA recombinase
MSTEHQRYSLESQIAGIAEYAAIHGYSIVRTYQDAGKSGLSLRGREGLKQLLADVVTGQFAFSTILILMPRLKPLSNSDLAAPAFHQNW